MKISLQEATFLIPIRIESDDRLRNVITTLCFLISNFDTNIIVYEVDRSSVFLARALPQIKNFICNESVPLEHIFVNSDSAAFHRQRVLNDMLMLASTEIVVNYDCDVLLPLDSYVSAYNLILSKRADVVYPYASGEFQRQIFADDELVASFLAHDFDFQILDFKSKKFSSLYGFVQFFNRQVYIDGGMENENFIAYGPEDVERFHRFNALGYKVSRVDSLVYHLEHQRTENSSLGNPYTKANNQEWQKIKKMSSETLKTYITGQNYYKNRIIGCSVIVCCHNSASRLPETLSHVFRQNLPKNQQWEVLLVDNASTDATADVALQVWRDLKSPVPLRIITEAQVGLSNARRAGVLQAKYNIILFCDDDNWLSSDYVASALEIMRSYPHVGVAGGSIVPVFEGHLPPPAWFYTYANGYAVGVQSSQTGDISDRGYIWGAGMVLRAPFLRQMYLNEVDPLLTGRSAGKMASGDDSEICKWYLMGGYQLWYDQRLCLSHFIPSGRQTKDYLVRQHEGFLAAEPILSAYDAWINRHKAGVEFKSRPVAWLKAQLRFWRSARDSYLAIAAVYRIVNAASKIA